tara:strand:- start:840 stop:1031 length:192 start_codon:yes stop_codon:yes gene_type:complete
MEKERVKLLKIQEAEAAGKLSAKKGELQDSSDFEILTPKAEKADQSFLPSTFECMMESFGVNL